MKKQMHVFRSLERALDRAIKGVDELRMRRDKALDIVLNDPPRMIQVTKEVAELRAKALKSKEVKEIMTRYEIKIENVALVDVWNERYFGLINGYPDPGSFYTDPDTMFNGMHNHWDLLGRYIFGSPRDTVKFFFRESQNHRSYFCGFMVNCPIKNLKFPKIDINLDHLNL